jgi:hypothetical protein
MSGSGNSRPVARGDVGDGAALANNEANPLQICPIDGQISEPPVILPVQPPLQKYFGFPESKIRAMIRHPVPHEGRIAIVTDVGMGSVDAAARRAELIAGRALAREWSGSRKTSGASCGRQSRVVP